MPRKKTANSEAEKIRKDAAGQFAGTQHGGDNDGVASAKPRVITGSDDATIHKWPPGTDDPPKEWSTHHDTRPSKHKD